MKDIVNDVTANFRQRCYFSYTDLYAFPIYVGTTFAFGESELMANIFSLPIIAKNIKCISNVGLEALRILFYSYWSFFRLEVCVYYYFYLGNLSSLSRTRNGI